MTWRDFIIIVVTVSVMILLVAPIIAFLFYRDIQKGNLKLDQLIKNLLRRVT